MTSIRSVLIAALAVLTGCGIATPAPEDHFYRVQPEFTGTPNSVAALEGVLVVDPVSADPLRGGRAVLFREQDRPLQLQRYHYAYWVEQPPKMVSQALQHYLRSSGVAQSVQAGRSIRARPDYEIQPRLLRFERVVGQSPSRVELELEISFRVPATGQVRTRVYQQQVAEDGDDMHATAGAMTEALEQVFAGVLDDLQQFEPDS